MTEVDRSDDEGSKFGALLGAFGTPWDGWDEPSILWGGLVGKPSQAKSPSRHSFNPIALIRCFYQVTRWPSCSAPIRMPDPVPPRRPSKGADYAMVQAALQRLWDLPFDRDDGGNTRPRITLLEPDAADEFQVWWEHKQWDAKLAAGGKLAGAIGKLDGVALRLAQVLKFLEWAWSKSNLAEPERVSIQSVRKALRIIDDWVRPNLERVFAEASLPQVQREAMTDGREKPAHP